MEHVANEPAIAYNRYYTEQEYLNMEWEHGFRYEYWDGQLVAMAGGSLRHAKIIVNLITGIDRNIRKLGCSTLGPDTVLKINEGNRFFLPDIMISCDENDNQAERFLTSPNVIIEILSDSTELYDRKQKWDQYRKIKSLRHYLLVNQHTCKVEMFSRTHENGLFYYQVFEGAESIIAFPDMGFTLALKDIYEGIEMKVEENVENEGNK